MSQGFRLYPLNIEQSSASFVTVNAEPDLDNSRVIAAGPGVTLSDLGTQIVISATGVATANAKYILLASDPALPNGRVIVAGDHIAITDNTSTVVIAASAVAPDGAGYITYKSEPDLLDERILTVGPGITLLNDGTNVALSVDSTVTRNSAIQTLTNKIIDQPQMFMAVTSVSTDYGALATDYLILVSAAVTPRTVTLPSAIGNAGRAYVVKKIDSSVNPVFITSPQIIDGSLSVPLRKQYESMTFASDGSAWFIL